MKNSKWRAFYPLLLAIYPAVGLVAVNISQMTLLAGMRSILVAVLFSFLVFFSFHWRIREAHKASLMCAWFLIFFFSYGHLYDAIEGWSLSGLVLGRHRFLFPLWLLFFGSGAWWLWKRNGRLEGFTRALNIISVILLVLPTVQIGLFEYRRTHSSVPEAASDMQAPVPASTDQPDVYYIILDSYSRADMLLEYYQLDISGFEDALEDMGFYTVTCSQSNYGVTDLSLATSLNMNYIEMVAPPEVEDQAEWISLGEPIRHSLVRQWFEEMGYQTVAFETGVWWSEIQDADFYFRKTTHGLGTMSGFWSATEFEILFLRTTVLRIVDELGSAWLGDFLEAPQREHAQYIHYTLDQLGKVPEIPGAKFVFVHLMAPHAPFVFSPEGDFRVSETASPGFPDEIQYLNTLLVPMVRSIIENSSTPPVIILQSDHGLDTEVRLANFISIYMPGGRSDVLYPTLTPVNIFRLVFNTYFGRQLPLLPDVSYYSFYDNYYDFTEVTYPCNP